MAEIHGSADARFERLGELLSASLDKGTDLGASVSLTIGGETVVDIWGGHADTAKTTPWQQDTITNVWSTTKTMTFLSMLLLVDRGQVDFSAPVATYWPEFAQNGKEAIEVRHLMGHTSGIAGWDQPVVTEDLYDWEKSTSMLAAQAPWWEPGAGSGYHALSQGHLLGEIVRRVSGKSLGTFFADEVADPLGADFHIGLDPSHFDRISNVVPPPPLPTGEDIDPGGVMYKTFTGPAPEAATSWTSEWRQAEIGAANGHGNARSVARCQSIVANGGSVDGRQYLSPATIEQIFEEQASGTDMVLGLPVRFGMGYALPSEWAPHLPAGRIGYWGGWGGSSIVVDCDRNMTFSYVMNLMDEGALGDVRGMGLIEATYEAMD